jgi:hypothetical protein
MIAYYSLRPVSNIGCLQSCLEFLELTDSAAMHVSLHRCTQMSSLRSNLQSSRRSSSSSSRHPQLHMALKPSAEAAASKSSTETTSTKLLTNADNLRVSTKQVSSGVIKKAAAGAAAQGVQGVQVGSDLSCRVLQTFYIVRFARLSTTIGNSNK